MYMQTQCMYYISECIFLFLRHAYQRVSVQSMKCMPCRAAVSAVNTQDTQRQISYCASWNKPLAARLYLNRTSIIGTRFQLFRCIKSCKCTYIGRRTPSTPGQQCYRLNKLMVRQRRLQDDMARSRILTTVYLIWQKSSQVMNTVSLTYYARYHLLQCPGLNVDRRWMCTSVGRRQRVWEKFSVIQGLCRLMESFVYTIQSNAARICICSDKFRFLGVNSSDVFLTKTGNQSLWSVAD